MSNRIQCKDFLKESLDEQHKKDFEVIEKTGVEEFKWLSDHALAMMTFNIKELRWAVYSKTDTMKFIDDIYFRIYQDNSNINMVSCILNNVRYAVSINTLFDEFSVGGILGQDEFNAVFRKYLFNFPDQLNIVHGAKRKWKNLNILSLTGSKDIVKDIKDIYISETLISASTEVGNAPAMLFPLENFKTGDIIDIVAGKKSHRLNGIENKLNSVNNELQHSRTSKEFFYCTHCSRSTPISILYVATATSKMCKVCNQKNTNRA